ncbi:MAG: phytoene/squalene synthase family protein [Acidimicrobiales bacterium]
MRFPPATHLVDDLGPVRVAERRAALADFGERFFADLALGRSDDPVLGAVVHTVGAFAIEPECFRRFLASMAMDLSVSTYETFDDLGAYMDGSAAVIGEMMLPVLEPRSPEAWGAARDLGIAFQLTNFIRDVGEDLDRDRTYLPQEDLRCFGAEEALAERRVSPQWVDLLRFEIGRARSYYAAAARGVDLLPPTSARCVAGARTLYARILERVEANGYDVFSLRARVSGPAKLEVAARVAVGGPRAPLRRPRRARPVG